MRTTIGSKIIIKDYTQELLDYATKELVFANPRYHLNKAIGKSTFRIPKEIVLYENKGNDLILPFGTLKEIFPLIKDYPYTLDFKPVETKKLLARTTLREYQKNALNGLLKEKGGVLVAPCGSGKTLIGMHLLSELKQRTLWVVHTSDLMTQAMNVAKTEFTNLEEHDIGTITEGKIDVGNVLTFATIQTLSKINLEDYKDYWNVVICDECQHICGTPTKLTMYSYALGKICARYKYGLTATPKRVDGLTKCMFALIGQKAYEITRYEVEQIKCKARLEIVPLSTSDNLYYYDSDYKLIPYKFDEYIATNVIRNTEIAKKILECAKDYKAHYQLVLCNRVVQCEILAKILKDNGLQVGVYNGSCGKKNNREILEHYTDYNVVVATYSIASEGLDMPKLDILHLASPKTKNNKSLLVQCIGRVERASPDKTEAIVYAYEDFQIAHSRDTIKCVKLAMGGKGYIFAKK